MTEANAHLAVGGSVRARRNGLHLPPRLSFLAWRRIGEQLSVLADSSAWWLGDWLAFGESRFDGRYKQAVLDTSLDYKTLRNYAWVARRFELSRRRDKLSFQHHAEVAALKPQEQQLWLDRAEVFGWSRNQLRRELRMSRDGGAPPVSGVPRHGEVLQLDVPAERSLRWHQAATRTNRNFEDWVTQALDEAANRLLGAAP